MSTRLKTTRQVFKLRNALYEAKMTKGQEATVTIPILEVSAKGVAAFCNNEPGMITAEILGNSTDNWLPTEVVVRGSVPGPGNYKVVGATVQIKQKRRLFLSPLPYLVFSIKNAEVIPLAA